MERLQVAVEKARAQRRNRVHEAARAGAGTGTGPATGPAPATGTGEAAPVRTISRAAARAAAAPVATPPVAAPASGPVPVPVPVPAPAPEPPGRAAAWTALRPLETSALAYRRNRIVSFEGGPAAAPYDLLRTKIIQQAQTHGWRRVAIVSPHSACGKTTTVANLVFSFARQKDLNTMILDLDLRRPALARVMGRTPKFNMADVLERRIGFADHGERYGDNVALGFNNEPVRNSSEVLQSQQTIEVLAEIEATWGPELMIFDMPPMLSSDDNFGFLKNVDCALLVVGAEQTPMHEIDVTERQLAELTNVMGVILNKCNYPDGAYGYKYGYY